LKNLWTANLSTSRVRLTDPIALAGSVVLPAVFFGSMRNLMLVLVNLPFALVGGCDPGSPAASGAMLGAMLPRTSVVANLPRLAGVLERHPDVLCAYVFGSVLDEARDRIRDVDVAVLGPETLSLSQVGGLYLELAKVLGTDAIDVVDLATARRALRFEILSRGRLLVDKAPAASARLRESTLREHLATRHTTRRYYERLSGAFHRSYARGAG